MRLPVSLFTCSDGWHITLWRLNVYWLRARRHWKPFRGTGGCVYWLRFCFELTK